MPLSFDVFLSHDHRDADWVEKLGRILTVKHGFKVWLDRWILIPGESWQQAIAKGLNETATCAVCVGPHTAQGWFRQEIERVLNIQASNSSYRVIPILSPDVTEALLSEIMPAFLDLRTWVDFRPGAEDPYALHILIHGIKGQAPGPWPPLSPAEPLSIDATLDEIERDLRALERLKPWLHETVIIEYERRILSRRFP